MMSDSCPGGKPSGAWVRPRADLDNLGLEEGLLFPERIKAISLQAWAGL
jgi:hypothetical protein